MSRKLTVKETQKAYDDGYKAGLSGREKKYGEGLTDNWTDKDRERNKAKEQGRKDGQASRRKK